MDLKNQARGYTGKVRFMFENSYRRLGADPKAHEMLFTNSSINAGRSLSSKSTFTGRRSPSRPSAGNMDLSASYSFSSNVHGTGVLLKALCGDPATVVLAESLTLSGSVENLGAGYVRLTCSGHGLRPFMQITISGTTNYDGVYFIQPESGVDDLVLESAYVAEDFSGTETVRRGAVRNLGAGKAVDRSGGLVGIPCAGHGYLFGETITFSGTNGYDGEHVVQPETTPDEIMISAAFADETFDGSESVAPVFYRHVYKMADVQPSVTQEQELELDDGPDCESITLGDGCKVSSFSCNSSGDGQLTFSLEMVGANRRILADSVAGSVTRYADFDFENFDAELVLGGETQSRVTSCGINVGCNLDTSAGYVKGSKGVRMSLPEGTPSLGGSLTAHYTDNKLLKKAMARTALDLNFGLVSGGNELHFIYPECLLQESGSTPKISGPQGVVVEFQIQGYEDRNPYGTCFVAELINGISRY